MIPKLIFSTQLQKKVNLRRESLGNIWQYHIPKFGEKNDLVITVPIFQICLKMSFSKSSLHNICFFLRNLCFYNIFFLNIITGKIKCGWTVRINHSTITASANVVGCEYSGQSGTGRGFTRTGRWISTRVCRHVGRVYIEVPAQYYFYMIYVNKHIDLINVVYDKCFAEPMVLNGRLNDISKSTLLPSAIVTRHNYTHFAVIMYQIYLPVEV